MTRAPGSRRAAAGAGLAESAAAAAAALDRGTSIKGPGGGDPARAAAEAFAAANLAEDRRLASLHLRLGSLPLALAELEELNHRSSLDLSGLAELGEARWRSGDIEAASDAAVAHLEAGGTRAISRVIAAEAAAAAGHPVEARVHVEALGAVEADALEHLFAGMPRRAFWPSAPNAPVGLESVAAADPAALPAPRPMSAGAAGDDGRAAAAGAHDESTGMVALWGDDEPAFALRAAERAARHAGPGPAEPSEELARAREELGSGVAGEVTRGLNRLALVLRQDPNFAPAVLDALGQRREVTAVLLRGDAFRIVGRRLEAEAAYAAAARLLEGPASDGS